jgi:hypothetical protein
MLSNSRNFLKKSASHGKSSIRFEPALGLAKERGKIVFFRVQYETKINLIWYPVVRYDTAHGFAHRDLLNFKERGRNNFLNYASQLQATFARSQITKISK